MTPGKDEYETLDYISRDCRNLWGFNFVSGWRLYFCDPACQRGYHLRCFVKITPMTPGERPRPPALAALGEFRPAPELGDWAMSTFINEPGELHNPRHAHLVDASIGWLWTSHEASNHGMVIAGECRMPPPMQKRWASCAAHDQVVTWFGFEPDYIITIASFTADWDDWSFCALVEHELCHTVHLTDQYDMPRFTRDGDAILGLRGHDVEQFVDVVARYGASAAGVADMVRVANKGPSIGQASIDAACGTCRARIAA